MDPAGQKFTGLWCLYVWKPWFRVSALINFLSTGSVEENAGSGSSWSKIHGSGQCVFIYVIYVIKVIKCCQFKRKSHDGHSKIQEVKTDFFIVSYYINWVKILFLKTLNRLVEQSCAPILMVLSSEIIKSLV